MAWQWHASHIVHSARHDIRCKYECRAILFTDSVDFRMLRISKIFYILCWCVGSMCVCVCDGLPSYLSASDDDYGIPLLTAYASAAMCKLFSTQNMSMYRACAYT